MDLSPKTPATIFEGDGGSYYTWLPSDFQLLADAKVGAGMLILKPGGFAFPHYADSSKLGFVLQGDDGGLAMAGMIPPNGAEEQVFSLRKGCVVAVPRGVVSWWYNGGDSDSVIVFIGETSKASVPGQFSYFFLSGQLGILTHFSTQVVSETYGISEEDATKLAKSQNGVLIVKLEEKLAVPPPHNSHQGALGGSPSFEVNKDGKFEVFGDLGLSYTNEKMEDNGISTPFSCVDGAVQVIYITKGSGKIEMVGLNGELVLQAAVQAGQLLVVPSFFVVAKTAGGAGGGGMDCISVITTAKPVFQQLAGKKSFLKALSPAVLAVSFDVDPQFLNHFME